MRSASASSAPLPPAAQSALLAIAHDLRYVPREALASPMDWLNYLRKQAARVDGVRTMMVPAPPVAPHPFGRPVSLSLPGAIWRRPVRRTLTLPKGRRVVVEVRQLELVLTAP